MVPHFMKVSSAWNPPIPWLRSTWDVKCLLSFLATQDPLSGLTLKQLPLKLAALLALTSSGRAHELVKLDLSFVSIKNDSWEFSLADHTKVSRLGHPPRQIYLPVYQVNPKIYRHWWVSIQNWGKEELFLHPDLMLDLLIPFWVSQGGWGKLCS